MNSLELTVIGCGTIELRRHSSSFLVQYCGKKLLFDMGRGTIDNLQKIRISPYDLDAIFITHFHSDHTIEIIPLISAIIHNPEGVKLKKRYYIYGPMDTKKRILRFMSVFDMDKKKFDKKFKIIELNQNSEVSISNLKIQAYNTKHHKTIKSLSYRINSDDKSLVYAGDTSKDDTLIKACINADLIILESTKPNIKGHMDGREAGEVAAMAHAKKLMITHVSPDYLKDAIKDARQKYNRKIILAKELMHLKI
ncbi:MAG: MBL fold metallo-hydrolase [Candidatus Woesearchaeota archaeon]